MSVRPNRSRQRYAQARRRRLLILSSSGNDQASRDAIAAQANTWEEETFGQEQSAFAALETQANLKAQQQLMDEFEFVSSEQSVTTATVASDQTVASELDFAPELDFAEEEPEASPFPFEPQGIDAVRALARRDEPTVWIFLGDENTLCCNEANQKHGYVDLFCERIRWELRRLPDVVINAGVPKSQITNMFDDIDTRCFRFRPDAVFIMPGLHDFKKGEAGVSAFQSSLAQLVQKTRDENAVPILQTPHQIDAAGLKTFPAYTRYLNVIREMSATMDVPIIDHWELTTQYPETQPEFGKSAQIHLAHNLFHELDIFDQTSETCSLQ